MPEDDVSDLRDVVDAINKLCDTMKTSTYEEELDTDTISSHCVDCSNDTTEVYASAVNEIRSNTVSQETLSSYYVDCSNDTTEVYASAVNEIRSNTVSQETLSSHYVDCSNDTTEVYASAVNEIRSNTVSQETLSSYYVDCSNDTTAVYASAVNEIRSNTVSQCFSDESEIDVQCGEYRDIELASPEDTPGQRVAERWSDATSQVSLPGQTEEVTSDTEPVLAQCDPVSEMYYTASSEVSLISDLGVPDKVPEDERDDRKECVIAGHVAAMRERFESMTRTNTPCPDLVRSLSPSLEVFRNPSPSPDRLA